MSLETKIIALAQAIGADVKTLTVSQGPLSSLNTTAKNNLVSAINELLVLIEDAGTEIDDAAGAGDLTVTWSASKIFGSIAAAKAAVKDEILNGAGTALDTLAELAEALGNDPNFAATIATELANRVRYDAVQSLTGPQQTQARSNIGAASATALSALTTAVGDTNRDFAADYATAKA